MIRITTAVAALVVALSALAASAQTLPDVDIFLASLAQENGPVVLGGFTNVTARPGYDNQPSFSPDGSYFLYTSIDSTDQSDVFRYDIAARVIVRITDTPQSEYSPTVVPGGDGFSSVRVEMDETQRLWRFDLDGSNARVVLADVDSVGYHVWINEHELALFIVGEPHSLRIVDTRDGVEHVVALDIGRALHLIPGTGEVSFSRRVADENLMFFGLDPATGETRALGRAIEGSADCAWTPGGTQLMATGRTLYGRPLRLPGSDAGTWRVVEKLIGADLAVITRIAVSPAGDYIALVASQ